MVYFFEFIFYNYKVIVKKKRIVNIDNYTRYIKEGIEFYITLANPLRFESSIKRMGFSFPLVKGETVLPSTFFGQISMFNAEGKYKKHKNRPMETAYRQAEWTWEQWAGRDETETHSKIVDIPYKRYPRTFIVPPAIELTITTDSTGKFIIVSPLLVKGKTKKEMIKHIANLFLEIFGEFVIFDGKGNSITKTNIKKLNWEILPKGKRPWEEAKKGIQQIVKQARKGNQVVIMHRLEKINNYGADFVAIGRAGFHGYIIFGFEDINIYVLESTFYGNATYIFNKDWEKLSQLTKAEILNDQLQEARIIHREGWEDKLDELMKKNS